VELIDRLKLFKSEKSVLSAGKSLMFNNLQTELFLLAYIVATGRISLPRVSQNGLLF